MKQFKAYLLVALILRLILTPLVWHQDLWNHVDWGIRFWQYGAKAFYTQNVWSFAWPNQPPGTMYMFAGVRKLYEFVFDIIWKVNINVGAFPSIIATWSEKYLYQVFLKLPAILSDFGIAYLIYKFVILLKPNQKGKKIANLAAILYLFNPVIWYNSSYWGQYDAVINFLAFLSFYLLVRKKLFFSMLLFALSIYTKASLLIFTPVYLIYLIRSKYDFKKVVGSLLLSILFILIITLPFAKGNIVVWLYELYKDKIFTQQLHVITANAFNIWATLTGISEKPDTLPFLGSTYQIWSYMLYLVFSIPLWVNFYKKITTKKLIWVLALTAFSSFTLLTNMHERYLYPLFPYLTILVVLYKDIVISYVLISLISLLNMYNFWFTPKIDFLVSFLSFDGRIMPRILGLLLTLIFINLYFTYFRQRSLQ